jgi:dihydrofolate synthase / folylpolyglutamate synthase
MAENREFVRALARLDSLTNWEQRPRGGMRVGLEPMLDLSARLGHPERSFRSIHVAGTKGKGSVSALIEAALARGQLRVGRYGSPHVERVSERVSLSGREVDEAVLARALARALDAYEVAKSDETAAAGATWFDLITASAFLIFAETHVEWAVIEVGLGGRLDSTNIVKGEIAIVTNIELEHTEVLGHSREAIAREKAGIVKPGAALITPLLRNDEAGRVIQARAEEFGCRITRPLLDPSSTIEETNVALAAAVLDELGRRGAIARLAEGERLVGGWLIDAETRAGARLPGRMERFAVDAGRARISVVLDGAHVPFNLKAVLSDLARVSELSGPCVAVVALAADKDATRFVAELDGRASAIVLTNLPGSSRGRPPAELKAIAASLGIASEVEPDAKHAYRRGLELAGKANAWLLVAGSLYLVGALRAAVMGEAR